MLSLGDQRSYYLGTAKNELGVVYAKHPISGEPEPCTAIVPVTRCLYDQTFLAQKGMRSCSVQSDDLSLCHANAA